MNDKGNSLSKPRLREASADAPTTGGVLLVDDHEMMRAGIACLIEQETHLRVCGEASTHAEAIEAIKRLKPDLAIVDITLAGSHGMDLLKDIKFRYPDLRILVLSMHDESIYAARCLYEGARGYVMKRESPKVFIAAIRQVLNGSLYFSQEVMEQVLNRRIKGQASESLSPLERLSNREVQVLELVGQGFKVQQISERLHLSIKTIETYREHIKNKLGLKDAASLLQFAVQTVKAEGGVRGESPAS